MKRHLAEAEYQVVLWQWIAEPADWEKGKEQYVVLSKSSQQL
jgi:hypothetical protein